MSKGILTVACTDPGYAIRIEGRGTAQDSAALSAFVLQYLRTVDRPALTIDLSACQYLDSTFLGCLLMVQRRFRGTANAQLSIVADAEVRAKLLRATNVDQILTCVEVAQPAKGTFLPLKPASLDARELGSHVVESHRALARVPSAFAGLFAEVAEKLAQELAGQGPEQDRPLGIRETV
jgi:anti-anti-sigma regulatory factor